jgi:acyl-coenzyme A synthetase/AMP-(fatty) acid ligase
VVFGHVYASDISVFYTGDGVQKDGDGYIWIKGRIDDLINVSGHRLSCTDVIGCRESGCAGYRSK